MRSLFFACAVLVGCGGQVVIGQPGEGGGSSASSSSSSASSASASASASSASTGGGVPSCFEFGWTGVGASCGAQQGVTCAIPGACCAQKATCQMGVWMAGPVACGEPCFNCGLGLGCAPGNVCVVDQAFETSYQCKPNPCPGPLDCSCAEPLCAENFQTCVGAMGQQVFCSCLDC